MNVVQEALQVPDVLVLLILFSGEPEDMRRLRRKLLFLPPPWDKYSKPWFPPVKGSKYHSVREIVSVEMQVRCQ